VLRLRRNETSTGGAGGTHPGSEHRRNCSPAHSGSLGVGAKSRPMQEEVSQRVLPELMSRLTLLDELGVGYLTLDRATNTLPPAKPRGYGLEQSWTQT